MEQKELAYSIADACKRVSVGKTTLYAAIKRDELIVHKVGRRTLVTAAALSAWVNSLPPSKKFASENQRGPCLQGRSEKS